MGSPPAGPYHRRKGLIGGGGTYAAIGARIWLPPTEIGMMVDRGHDFPASIEANLLEYGPEMWIFRDQPDRLTTRALNSYKGDHRNFQYITPRIRITPKDLASTRIPRPRMLHFICSPTRASTIMSEVRAVQDWYPTTIYEPIPDRCVPEELPALIEVLPSISILSPNAEEALSLLSIPLPPTRASIEEAADRFLQYGVGHERKGWIIVRSGEMGAFVKSLKSEGRWVDAFWTASADDAGRIVDVTGAGNSFLGGLAAGLLLTNDVLKATFYASASASFIVEQEGLPRLSRDKQGHLLWNGDLPQRRLDALVTRHGN
ncbi:putative pfkB family carbohydrate kinase [Lyophyllum shimeji]|uniref:PfkB family carbohydrate kinase n=1 Tax=Lyophyllum shimeji TaxID=47721 RepID=A0A9P3PDR0_LYOSH|nr:putative pfkB family carbohydrate kinase [Lyophyllum shimeji]